MQPQKIFVILKYMYHPSIENFSILPEKLSISDIKYCISKKTNRLFTFHPSTK